jgi:adenylate cyclase
MTALALCAGLSPAVAQTPSRPTLVVLPLDNNSGDATQDFFAGGMTDEIAVALTGVKGLGVVARSSSFLLKPTGDTKITGEKLGASHLVQGSARIAAERVQLNVRLVRAGDGAQLWSQDYDVARADIFTAQEDIAQKIAAALKAPVGPGETLVRNRSIDFDTYLDFLRAKVAARPRGAAALGDAAAFLEKVLVRDPEYAPAAAPSRWPTPR